MTTGVARFLAWILGAISAFRCALFLAVSPLTGTLTRSAARARRVVHLA